MATIEQLNFELLIDDKDFNTKVDQLKKESRQLNADISKLLEIKAKNTKTTRETIQSEKLLNKLDEERKRHQEALNRELLKTATAQEKLNQAMGKTSIVQSKLNTENAVGQEKLAQATTKTAIAQERLNRLQKQSNGYLLSNSKLFRELGALTMTYFSVDAARRLVSELIQISAEFEKQRVSLGAILQSEMQAETIFNQIKQLAVVSPFNFKELVTYAKQLSAFAIPVGELYETTKMLADVSAGLGVGMDRLVLAYGQIRSAEFLRGQEVRQLTEAGIPILQELSRQLTDITGKYVSVGEVFDRISARQVTFQMVQKVFNDMTSEGGKFYKMQEVLADTLSGKISNLVDAYQILFAEIGKNNSGILYDTVDTLRKIIENFEELGKDIAWAVGTFGVAKVAMYGYQLAIGATTIATSKLAQASYGLWKSFLRNPYALLAAGVALYVTHLAKLLRMTSEFERRQEIINGSVEKYNKSIYEEGIKLEYLKRSLDNATEGTKAYTSAKKQLLSQYGEYLTDLDREQIAVGNLTEVYGRLKDAIRDAYKEKYMQEGGDELRKSYMDTYEKIFDDFDIVLKQFKISKDNPIAQQLADYIRGDVSENDLTKEARQFIQQIANIATGVYSSTTGAAITSFKEVSIQSLKDGVSEAKAIFDGAMTDLASSLDLIYGVDKKKGDILTGWRAAINEIVKEAEKAGVSVGLKIDKNSALSSVVDDVKSAIEETTKAYEINLGLEDKTAEVEKKRLGYLNRINAALLGKATPQEKGSGKDERVESIQNQINLYKKLQQVYEGLVGFMGEEKTKKAMEDMFPTLKDNIYKNYRAEIGLLIGSLERLGEEGRKAADALKMELGMDKYTNIRKTYEEALKSAELYQSFMQGWYTEDDLEGQGSAFNVSKIVSAYVKKIKEIKDKEQKAYDLLFGREADKMAKDELYDPTDFINEEAAITKKAIDQQTQTLKQAKENLRKEADNWVKEWIGEEGYNLEQFSDLTERQLRGIKQMIDNFDMSALPQNIKDQLLKLGDTAIPEFEAALKDALGKMGLKVDVQLEDKNIEKINRTSKVVRSLAESVKDVADASGNDFLSGLMDGILLITDMWDSMSESLKKGDLLNAILAPITVILEKMTSWIGQTYRLRNAIKEAAKEAEKYRVEMELASKVDTIFGENTAQKVKNAQGVIDDYRSSINALNKEATTFNIKWKSGLFNWGRSTLGLKEAVEEMGYSLFAEDGLLNTTALQAILDTYETLTQKEKEWIEGAIRDTESYRKAIEQLEEAISSLVGDVANDFADAIIAQWKAAGSAALDYSDILNDIAENYAKMVIQSAILEQVFDDEFKKQLKQYTAAMDAEGAMRLFDTAAQEIEGLMPYFTKVLDGMKKWIKEDTSSSTLAGGVKSITEDTANLLASYINAMRADLSVNRVNIEKILGLLPQSPTLADYLTKIEANTYNTAEKSTAILSRIDAMMTSAGGQTSLRVEIQ